MSYTAVMNLVPTVSSLALVGENVRVATKKGKKKAGDIIWLGMTNIIGTSLIRAQAGMIGGI